jgi:hypothetical protein
MSKVGKAKAAKAVADFLFRYMVARYRCVGGALPSSRIQLTADVKQGVHLFEGDIATDAAAWPPVTNDREHHAFFVAIISADDSAIPEIEPAELAAWRNYVLNSGPVPKWREPVRVSAGTRAEAPARRRLTFRWAAGLSNWLPRGWSNRAPGSPLP